MDKATIIDYLNEYNFSKARSQYLQIVILQQKYLVEKLKAQALTGGNLPGSQIGCMPRASSISDPTFGLVGQVLSGQYPHHIQQEIDELEKLEDEQHSLDIRTAYVDVLIESLTEKESFVVRQRYFQECTWPEIARRCEAGFGYYSIEGVKKILQRAIKKMVRIAA